MLEDIKQKIMESEDPIERQDLIYKAKLMLESEGLSFNRSVDVITEKYILTDGIVDSTLSSYAEEYKQANVEFRYGGSKDKAKELACSSIIKVNEFANAALKQVLAEINQQSPIKVDVDIKTISFPVPEDEAFLEYYNYEPSILLFRLHNDAKSLTINAEYLENAFTKIVKEAERDIKRCIAELSTTVTKIVADKLHDENSLLNKLRNKVPLGKTVADIEKQYNSCVNEVDSIVDKYTVSGGLIEKCFDDILAKYKSYLSNLSKDTENSDKILEQKKTEAVKEIKGKTESLQKSLLSEIQDAFSLFIDLSKPPIAIGVNLDSSIPQHEELVEDKHQEQAENDIAGIFTSLAKALSEVMDWKENSQIDFDRKKDNSNDEIENLCIVATSSLSRYAFKLSTIYGAEAVQTYFNKKQEILNLK